MSVNVGGIISVSVFYALILAVGIVIGWRRKNRLLTNSDGIILAGRDMGLFVGVLTMTATWVAGGYINGTCEGTFSGGFLRWSPIPIGYALSLLIGGSFFAKPMRERGYVTMLDPFQEKYGARVGGLLFIPALLGEIVWSAAILSSLGSLFYVMLNMNHTFAIIISASVAVLYTLWGGLYSVAYTDVLQLIFVVFGLVFCVPFVWTHEAIDHEVLAKMDLIGQVTLPSLATYLDIYLLIIFGGIPWQVYFQRVLACRTSQQAQVLSYAAAVGCLLLAVPPAILGSVARAADWVNGTEWNSPILPVDHISILPIILQYLTPKWVSYIGLGAVSAAIMSSADSTILSSSSMFVHNIYKNVFFPWASEKHMIRAMWFSIVISAVLGTVMALKVNTIFGLSYLCSDVVYVVLFPQLVLVIYGHELSNTYGSLVAFFVGLTLRFLSGEALVGLPAVINFPFYDEKEGEQLFPFRTFIMLLSASTQVAVSVVARRLFIGGYLSLKWDVFECFSHTKDPNRAHNGRPSDSKTP